MKAYAMDLRERVVKFIQEGGTRAEAARRFSLGERSVYRYLAAAKTDTLAPKTTWGGWRKLDPAKLAAHVQQHPDATLHEIKAALGVSHNAVWVRLRQLGYTLKKTRKISGTERGTALAVRARDRKAGSSPGVLPRRVRRGSSAVSPTRARPQKPTAISNGAGKTT